MLGDLGGCRREEPADDEAEQEGDADRVSPARVGYGQEPGSCEQAGAGKPVLRTAKRARISIYQSYAVVYATTEQARMESLRVDADFGPCPDTSRCQRA